jgi:hypothetical protein
MKVVKFFVFFLFFSTGLVHSKEIRYECSIYDSLPKLSQNELINIPKITFFINLKEKKISARNLILNNISFDKNEISWTNNFKSGNADFVSYSYLNKDNNNLTMMNYRAEIVKNGLNKSNFSDIVSKMSFLCKPFD